MKEKLEAFLRMNGNWKRFINEEPNELKQLTVLGVNVTTFLQEGKHVYFDVSIIYAHPSGQKQSYESGVAALDKNGNVTEAREMLP
jgi:hypothetical protein